MTVLINAFVATPNGDLTPIYAPSELNASLTVPIIRDITTTRQKLSFPSGAKWIHISYRALPGSAAVTNQFLKIVVNASSDADADGKLATDNSFIPIFQGDDMTFSADSTSLVTRVDLIAALAVGAEKTIVRILAGV